jgi:hypothetical protein
MTDTLRNRYRQQAPADVAPELHDGSEETDE